VAFRFRRSIGLFPGVRLNLSKSGASVSLGVRGARHTLGLKGSRTTVGLPGTGLSWTEYKPHQPKRTEVPASNDSFRLDVGTNQFSRFEADEKAIDSAPINAIAAHSTSDLAPILDQLNKRWRFSRLTTYGIVVAVGFGLYSQNQEWLFIAFGLLVAGLPLTSLADRYRRTIGVKYNLISDTKAGFNTFLSAFDKLRSSQRIWHIPTEQRTLDWKRNAGASKLVKRRLIGPRWRNPVCVRANIKFPTLDVGAQRIQFGPDAVIVSSQNSVAVLSYRDVVIDCSPSRFIEDDSVPTDSEVVDHTWQYPNKRGGPDRRFQGNRQLSICLYGEIEFQSAGGLYERIQCSNVQAAIRFAAAVNGMRELMQQDTISAVKKNSSWPTVLLTTFGIFVFFALGLVGAGDPTIQRLVHGQNILSSPENIPKDISAGTPAKSTLNGQPKVRAAPPLPAPRPPVVSADPWAKLRQ
jgi:hypothetical protein